MESRINKDLVLGIGIGAVISSLAYYYSKEKKEEIKIEKVQKSPEHSKKKTLADRIWNVIKAKVNA